MYLYGNPLQCDCQLQEVWRWCKHRNIWTAYRRMLPKCYTPSEVKGLWWGVVEKGQCLQGNIHYYGDYKNIRFSYTPIEDTDTETKQGKNVPSFLKQYQLPISAILFIFGTTGNVIITIIIISNKDMQTVPNMYIRSLSTSDIIYLRAIFTNAWLDNVMWLRGDTLCTLLSFCNRMSVCLTTNFINVLSIRLYRVTANPFHVRVSSQPAWFATVTTVFGVWIVAPLFTIPAAHSQYLHSTSIFLWLTNYYLSVLIFKFLVSC